MSFGEATANHRELLFLVGMTLRESIRLRFISITRSFKISVRVHSGFSESFTYPSAFLPPPDLGGASDFRPVQITWLMRMGGGSPPPKRPNFFMGGD